MAAQVLLLLGEGAARAGTRDSAFVKGEAHTPPSASRSPKRARSETPPTTDSDYKGSAHDAEQQDTRHAADIGMQTEDSHFPENAPDEPARGSHDDRREPKEEERREIDRVFRRSRRRSLRRRRH